MGSRSRIGLGSFAFRYAIGVNGAKPQHPMGPSEFLQAARELGYEGVQLCENLRYADLPSAELKALAAEADALGLFTEIGMNSLSEGNLSKHLDIAKIFKAKLLRVVIGRNSALPEADPQATCEAAAAVLQKFLPRCLEQGVTIGLENHFDVPAALLVKIAEQIDHPNVGLIFDSTNGLGFLERPEQTLKLMQPYLVSAHIKDYHIRKVEAGYFITGTALGAGLLDTRAILSGLVDIPSLKSVILELTIRRDDGVGIEETVKWERRNIEESTKTLREMVASVKNS